MKLMFASDIHGSLPATERVLERISIVRIICRRWPLAMSWHMAILIYRSRKNAAQFTSLIPAQ